MGCYLAVTKCFPGACRNSNNVDQKAGFHLLASCSLFLVIRGPKGHTNIRI